MAGVPAARQNIELLTSIKSVGPDGVSRTKCFGNILELSRRSLVLESSRRLASRERLTLSLVFPGLRRSENPIVCLDCVVRRVRDRDGMQCELVIENMDDTARDRLTEYLSRPTPCKEG